MVKRPQDPFASVQTWTERRISYLSSLLERGLDNLNRPGIPEPNLMDEISQALNDPHYVPPKEDPNGPDLFSPPTERRA